MTAASCPIVQTFAGPRLAIKVSMKALLNLSGATRAIGRTTPVRGTKARAIAQTAALVETSARCFDLAIAANASPGHKTIVSASFAIDSSIITFGAFFGGNLAIARLAFAIVRGTLAVQIGDAGAVAVALASRQDLVTGGQSDTSKIDKQRFMMMIRVVVVVVVVVVAGTKTQSVSLVHKG